MMSGKSILQLIFVSFLFAVLTAGTALAQGTGFNFQGRLNDGTNPANGSYDLQFRLYDAIAGGTQIGAVVARPNTTLINGVFSVTLDFGAAAFNNPNSVFIEISVKPNGSPNAFTILGPRQQLTIVPFAVRAANAMNADNAVNAQNSVNATNATTAANSLSLGGVAAGNYLQTNGNGSQLTNVNAVTATTANNALNLGGVAANNYARLDFANQGNVLATGLLLTNDARQPASGNGLIKAMVYVNANGSIIRCYNGILNSTTGNCGFLPVFVGTGQYNVNFGFRVDDRFISITPTVGDNVNIAAGFDINGFGGGNVVNIRTFRTDVSFNSYTSNAFMIIIF